MKRSLFLAIAVMFVVALSSCTKKYVTPNNNITVVDRVNVNRWVPSDDGKAFSAEIPMPELDNYYNESGAVLAYIAFAPGVYEQIPQVYDGISYSFYHSIGKVVIYAQTASGSAPVKPQNNLDVKVVLIESNEY